MKKFGELQRKSLSYLPGFPIMTLSKAHPPSSARGKAPTATFTKDTIMSKPNTSARKPANKKFGSQRGNKARRVVSLRNKGESWASIAADLDIAPRTARRLYDERQGQDAHFASRIPGKGGRTRQVPTTEA